MQTKLRPLLLVVGVALLLTWYASTAAGVIGLLATLTALAWYLTESVQSKYDRCDHCRKRIRHDARVCPYCRSALSHR